MNPWILLHELPVDHPLRNTPLRDLEPEFNCTDDTGKLGGWKGMPGWKIMRATYNQLGENWTSNGFFRVSQEKANPCT